MKNKQWKAAGASVKGRSHSANDLPCQDRVYATAPGKVSVVALSDGAGSCRYSHYGAEIVVKETCKLLGKRFHRLYGLTNEQIASKVLNKVLKKIKRKVKRLKAESTKEFSATLLFVAVSDTRYILGHIGDGVIGQLIRDRLNIISYPENGEYLNTTFFVTGSDALKHMRIQKNIIEDTSGFILMSDGASESLYDRQRLALSPVSEQILDWLDDNDSETVSNALYDNIRKFFIPRTSDDCSIVLMKFVGESQNNNETTSHQQNRLNDSIIKIKKFYKKLIATLQNE